MQLIQPAQLPAIQVARPLQAYFAGQEMAKQEKVQAQQMEMQQRQMQMQEMKLQEYQEGAPMRKQQEELAMVQQIMQTDTQMMAFGKGQLAQLDPDSENFDQDAMNVAVNLERYLVERVGVSQDTAGFVIGNAVKSGGFSRETVIAEQIKQGLRPTPKGMEHKEKDGQVISIDQDTGEGAARPIAGYQPPQKPEATSPLAKLLAERNATPPGSPDRVIYDKAIAKTVEKTGESIELDSEGNLKITRGGGAGAEKAPTGFRYKTDGSGDLEAIPGGPVAMQVAEDAEDKAIGTEVKTKAAQTVYEDTERALVVLDKYGLLAGGVAGVTRHIPTLPASQLQKHYDSIKGNVGIDSLIRIKESGAGLGHIPQTQLEMLASLLGKLDVLMLPEDQRFNLLRIQELYADIVEKEGGDPKEMYKQRQDRLSERAAGGGAKPDEPKQLDQDTARQYMESAGGDKDKARQMARDDGYIF